MRDRFEMMTCNSEQVLNRAVDREGIVQLTRVGDNRPMGSLYRRHRFPLEIISHAV